MDCGVEARARLFEEEVLKDGRKVDHDQLYDGGSGPWTSFGGTDMQRAEKSIQ